MKNKSNCRGQSLQFSWPVNWYHYRKRRRKRTYSPSIWFKENPNGFELGTSSDDCWQNKVEKYSANDLDKLEKKLTAQFEKGMEVAKIAKAYTLEELTLIAARHEIVAEKNDTPVTLVQALLEEFEEQSK